VYQVNGSRVEWNPSPARLRELTEEMPNASVTEFGNVNVKARVDSRSTRSTYLVDDSTNSRGQTITRSEYDRVATLSLHVGCKVFPVAGQAKSQGPDGRVRGHGRPAQAGAERVPRLLPRPGRVPGQIPRVRVMELGLLTVAFHTLGTLAVDRHGDEEGGGMRLRDLVYRLYERRVAASLSPEAIPRHVGVMCDGNRRWARSAGFLDVSKGHRKGADKIFELLEWCRESGVEVVTLWLLSTDNLTRESDELVPLLKIIEDTVQGLVAERWHVNPVGALDLLPGDTVRVLKDAADATAHYPGLLVNVAVGYGGRREIADAVRSLLQDHATRGTTIEELAEVLDVEHIAEHLYTAGQPDPDLVIRTSGEQRLGGFLLWQSTHSEFYFCDAYWPAFRKVDFLRALRSYAARNRRFGT
jgi:short-chain Z-isoprenyl diphosphate synthase